ncbi:hypothetical protein VCHC17A1_3937B, partial [Vibrio cholerae HC-17A1]
KALPMLILGTASIKPVF